MKRLGQHPFGWSACVVICLGIASACCALAFAQQPPPAATTPATDIAVPPSESPPAAASGNVAASSSPTPSGDGSAAPTTQDSAAQAAPPDGGGDTANADDLPAPAAPAPFYDLRRAAPITGDAAAGKQKSAVCMACHGEHGIAIAPNFPNIAGQHIDYLYWQLREFKTGASAMTPLVADLSDDDMRNLAAYYAAMKPTAAAPTAPEPAAAADGSSMPAEAAEAAADPAQLQRGQALYMHGDIGKGIPPCQGCHGGDARGFPGADVPDRAGHRPFATYPALRGQQAIYLQTKLAEFQAGTLHGSSTDIVMSSVGARLDPDSIQAVSTWLSTLPP